MGRERFFKLFSGEFFDPVGIFRTEMFEHYNRIAGGFIDNADTAAGGFFGDKIFVIG